MAKRSCEHAVLLLVVAKLSKKTVLILIKHLHLYLQDTDHFRYVCKNLENMNKKVVMGFGGCCFRQKH